MYKKLWTKCIQCIIFILIVGQYDNNSKYSKALLMQVFITNTD